jgi:hypothetical protein
MIDVGAWKVESLWRYQKSVEVLKGYRSDDLKLTHL